MKSSLHAVSQLFRPAHLALLALSLAAMAPALAQNPNFHNVPNGDVAGLISAINISNASPGADTIELASGGTYTLTAVNNTGYYVGPSGLPAITSQITINGHGATIQRSSAAGIPDFRILLTQGNVTLNEVTIAGGKAAAGAPNYRGGGGGIRNEGTLLLRNSTVRNNSCSTGINEGGGIINYVGGQLTVINSTISYNTSNGSRAGGGILNMSAGSYVSKTTILNSTIFENRADGSGGSARGDAVCDFFSPAGSVIVKNSILASPTQGLGSDLHAAAGVLTSLGLNIVSDASGGLTGHGDLNSTNPQLRVLEFNAGPAQTQTHQPENGSPAIDAVPVADCTDANGTPITTDQNGLSRPQGLKCDIGSVEAFSPARIAIHPSGQTVCAGETATFSVTAEGTPPFSYQWRKNGAPISGATSASYTTAATVAGDNGVNFTVVVSNSVGNAVSNNAKLTVNTPPSITTQPGNQTVNAGQTATFSVTAAGGGLYSYQWKKNGDDISGATGVFYTTPATTSDNGAFFSVTVTNSCGSVTSNNATLTVAPPDAEAGSVDPPFNPAANGSVYSAAVQPDGKIAIGGTFTTVGGVTRNRIARLNADGTLDSAFNPDPNGLVFSIAVQADGKIIVGGAFSSVDGVVRNGIARLNADGTLDPAFDPNSNGTVRSVAMQADGKLVIGGSFTSLGGVARNYLARLNADGTLDSAFNPNTNSSVLSILVQADARIVIGGPFNSVGGVTRNRIARLHADGTLDSAFDPDASFVVYSLAGQVDGKIVIGGDFNSVGGVTRNRIARLHADGALDPAFNPGADNVVYSIAVQADEKIVIGGLFSSISGVPRNRVARLHADGILDSAFNPNANFVVYSITVQADGKIVIGGDFNTVGGVTRNRIARLNNDPAVQSLTGSASRVEWLRGGAAPETDRVTFELSTDGGASWVALGAGTRIAGGWQLSSLSLPNTGQIRARGRTSGGFYNSSTGLIEQIAAFNFTNTPPDTTILTGPSGTVASNAATFTFTGSDDVTPAAQLTFEVSLDGALPFTPVASNSVNLSNLAEGTHTFAVRAIDAAGNVDPTPAVRVWTVDMFEPAFTALFGWGFNNSGEVGDGTIAQRNAPVNVLTSGALANKTVLTVAAGIYHSVALSSDGLLFAWGNNSSGTLGDGTHSNSTVPVAVNMSGLPANDTVMAIAAGDYHTLALTASGTSLRLGQQSLRPTRRRHEHASQRARGGRSRRGAGEHGLRRHRRGDGA